MAGMQPWEIDFEQQKDAARDRAKIDKLEDRISDLTEALQHIVQWSEAYPLSIFPEPDLKKAAALLEAGGITLDAISASCMRHVIEGVGNIAKDVLKEEN
jgi:hypothetical protein